MTLNDSLANGLSKINTAEAKAKTEVVLKSSKMLKQVLEILNRARYVGAFEEKKDVRGTSLLLPLLGSINKCGVIKPRFSYTYEESEKVEKKYLPAKGFGVIVVSTSQGVMTLDQSKEKKVGGRLIAYCY